MSVIQIGIFIYSSFACKTSEILEQDEHIKVLALKLINTQLTTSNNNTKKFE